MTYRLKFFWNFDAAENNCFIVVFFFGFLRCIAGVSNGISDASSGRANRTAPNKSSRIRCRPAKRGSRFSTSRQARKKKIYIKNSIFKGFFFLYIDLYIFKCRWMAFLVYIIYWYTMCMFVVCFIVKELINVLYHSFSMFLTSLFIELCRIYSI